MLRNDALSVPSPHELRLARKEFGPDTKIPPYGVGVVGATLPTTFFTAVECTTLPAVVTRSTPVMGFDWRRVTPEQTAAASAPPGVYAAPSLDQHADAWCGLCYIVCVVQMIEDRWRVAAARAGASAERLDVQSVADFFQSRADGPGGWNVCHGGQPDEVAERLADGTCPLVVGHRGWSGFARPGPARRYRGARHAPLRLSRPRSVHSTDIARELLDGGPLVLCVASSVLRETDADGVARRALHTPALPANHAVSVVGWRTTDDGIHCWIVRNSWPHDRAPTALPPDLGCVGIGTNRCVATFASWSSLDGFVLLPFAYAGLALPGTWMAVDVTLVKR